jgi:hypothetical protein
VETSTLVQKSVGDAHIWSFAVVLICVHESRIIGTVFRRLRNGMDGRNKEGHERKKPKARPIRR